MKIHRTNALSTRPDRDAGTAASLPRPALRSDLRRATGTPWSAVPIASLLALGLLVGSPAPASADDYTDRLASAETLEAEGRFDDAVAALAPLAETFPQDTTVALRLAWLNFQAAHYPEARGHYQRAIELSARAPLAVLGLAWTEQRLGHPDAAVPLFEEVLAAEPDNASAQEGLALIAATEAPHGTVGAGVVAQVWSGHPSKRTGLGLIAAADGALDGVALGVTYRGVELSRQIVGLSRGPQSAAVSTGWTQHEVYGRVGVEGETGSLTLHYGGVFDGFTNVHAVGLAGVLDAPYASPRLEVSGALFGDAAVWRGELSAWAPLGLGFGVLPLVAGQWADDTTWLNAGLALAWLGDSAELAVGGTYGDAWLPVNFAVPSIANTFTPIPFSAFGRASVRLGEGLWLGVVYAWVPEELLLLDGTTRQANGHLVTLGLGFGG